MNNNDKVVELAKNAQEISLLYVEDNKGLQQQASKIFKKIFNTVITADDGESGLKLFKEYTPRIVITDVNMPKLNGIKMAKMIKHIEPTTHIIITSAYDDKEYLFAAIDAKVSKYLKKPLTVDQLIKTLDEAVNEINFEKNKDFFQHYIKDVFQYQDNLLILVKADEVLIANKKVLDFFVQDSLESFREFFKTFGSLLLKHNNFLYNRNDVEWLSTVKNNSPKLFNVKIADKEGNSRHFILKAYKIADKDDTFILSFDDITELNLLSIYDKNATKVEKQEAQKKTIYNILEIIKRNNSNIKIYNSYKGLLISNIGLIGNMSEDEIVLQTQYPQLRVISINKTLTIESELFPNAVFCNIKKVDFENGYVVVKDYKFIEQFPSQQEFVRVEPEENHKVTLFYDGRKIITETKIINISVGGAKIALSLIPAGFKIDNEVIVDMVFKMGQKPLIINIKAQVINLIELSREFEIILTFDNNQAAKKLLTEYIANRQMALIREFKEL